MKRRVLHVPGLHSAKAPKLLHAAPSDGAPRGSQGGEEQPAESGDARAEGDGAAEDAAAAAAPAASDSVKAAFQAPSWQRKPFVCRTNSSVGGTAQPQQQGGLFKPRQQLGAGPAAAAPAAAGTQARYFTVLYTKREKLKKKADKGFQDGVIELVAGAVSTLYDAVRRCRLHYAGSSCCSARPGRGTGPAQRGSRRSRRPAAGGQGYQQVQDQGALQLRAWPDH